MSVFKSVREFIRPVVRGNVRPDSIDSGALPQPVTGSLLIETGDFFLLETGDKLLLE